MDQYNEQSDVAELKRFMTDRLVDILKERADIAALQQLEKTGVLQGHLERLSSLSVGNRIDIIKAIDDSCTWLSPREQEVARTAKYLLAGKLEFLKAPSSGL